MPSFRVVSVTSDADLLVGSLPAALPVEVLEEILSSVGLPSRNAGSEIQAPQNNKIFKRPKNHEDGSNLDDFWRESIVSTRPIF